MNPVFYNTSLQKHFHKKGYVLLPSLLNASEISSLHTIFSKFQNQYIGSFHTTHFSNDILYKQQVHDAISTLVFPKAAPYLNHFTPLFGNFMVKNPDPSTSMDLHADWTYVDETKSCSAAIWIPLVDVAAENGCLGVIEGSHKVTNIIRGPLIRQSSRQNDKVWAKRYGKLISMKAGDAIIYDHRLLHYSPPNKTLEPRPALNLSVVPEAVSWLHYCMPEGTNEIEIYSVSDSSFFIHYNNYQSPQNGMPIKRIPKETVKYIDSKMEKFWKNQILSKILKWI